MTFGYNGVSALLTWLTMVPFPTLPRWAQLVQEPEYRKSVKRNVIYQPEKTLFSASSLLTKAIKDMTKALLITDYQYDFLDGSLATPKGHEIFPIIRTLLDQEDWQWDVIIVSQDYHPKGHISFASSHKGITALPLLTKTVTNAHGETYDQRLWPEHCVMNTKGVELDEELQALLQPLAEKITLIRKGSYTDLEAYSAFQGCLMPYSHPMEPPSGDGSNTQPVPDSQTELAKFLREKAVDRLVVTGIAAEICVQASVFSAVEAKIPTWVIEPGVACAFPQILSDSFKPLEEAGATIIKGDDWQERLRQALRN